MIGVSAAKAAILTVCLPKDRSWLSDTATRGAGRARSTLRGVITAIVLVHTAPDRIPETAQEIADLDGVAEVYSCAGDIDLVAIIRVAEHEQLAEVIAGRLSKLPGVRRTDTHIAFRAYSRRDTEAGFSVGQD
jgi:DNA-binding Lrp family transcriptional regulator